MTNTHLVSPTRSLRIQPTLQLMAAFTASIVALGLLTGCAPEEPPPTGVSNTNLDLSIGYLGDDWAVQTNQGSSLVVVPSNIERQGTVEFLVGPETEGINLVEALDTHQGHIESLPDGVYSGAQELAGPMGAAFYSRGRYGDGDSTIEETRIFSLHPRSSRMIEMVYRYPAGSDSSTRVSEMIELFAEVE